MKNIPSLEEFAKELNEAASINESGITDAARAIDNDLQKFLIDVVIVKSKGYVKNERDAALLLYDILKTKFAIRS